MTRIFAVTAVLIATGLAACSQEPEPISSIDNVPPGASQPDRPRDVPYREANSRYSTDRYGSAPRTGINSDPNNPSGAPGSTYSSTFNR